MKKISKIVAMGAFAVILASNVAYANSTSYDFRLPATGSKHTSDVNKQTNEKSQTNDVNYLGWEGTEINCWTCSTDDDELTSKASFSETGNVYMYMPQNLANDYVGNPVNMKLKTSTSTMHKCDISGEFDPN